MHIFIFQNLFGIDSVNKALISSSESEDDLGVVLRLHLITESFLEAFICSAIRQESLFDTSPENGKPFKLNYFKKLELAAKLGLPVSSYKALDKLNSLRNNLAHRIQNDFIDNRVLESITSHVRDIDGDKNVSLKEEAAEFFTPDGTSRGVYYLNSSDTPSRIKLIILVSSLIRRTTDKCIGFYNVQGTRYYYKITPPVNAVKSG